MATNSYCPYGLWFQCQFSFESLHNALWICSGCVPPNVVSLGPRQSIAVPVLKVFGILIRVRSHRCRSGVSPQAQLYGLTFPSSSLFLISQVSFDFLSSVLILCPETWGFRDFFLSYTSVIGLTFWPNKGEDREKSNIVLSHLFSTVPLQNKGEISLNFGSCRVA